MGEYYTIMVSDLFGETKTARLSEIEHYYSRLKQFDVDGRPVRLTGGAPIWLYLIVAHALHGRVSKLVYNSPNTGDIEIYDHTVR